MTSDEHSQAPAPSTKPDNPLYSSADHCTPSSDTLLEYGDSATFEGLDNQSLDSEEPSFTDLFTESEFSQDTENVVCDCHLLAAHLTNDLGYTSCDFRTILRPQQLKN